MKLLTGLLKYCCIKLKDKKLYSLFIIAVFILFPFEILSQSSDDELPQVMPVSPTAAALGKYGDVPVSFATGTPNISIPLGSIQGRELSLDISMSYHAGGVKLDEVPGWVGLGWSLNAGGVITRNINGLADDQAYGWLETSGDCITYLNTCSSGNGGQWCTDYVEAVKSGLKDSEPDDFYFNFDGMSGRFVINESGIIRTIPYQKLKISYETGIYDGNYTPVGNVQVGDGKCINSFKIIRENGVQYEFTKKEVTYNPLGAIDAVPNISAWYLTKILSPGEYRFHLPLLSTA